MRIRLAMGLAVVSALTSAGQAFPDPLVSGKSTVDGGGVSFAAAGSFVLGGTIGQPDAGSLIYLPFVLVGGFWGGSAGATVSVGDEPPDSPGPVAPPPVSLRIHPATPNPAAAGTRLDLELPEALPARVRVYDVRGARVRSLVARDLPAGRHRLEWDGRDDTGQPVAPGLYLFQIEVGPLRSAQKVVVVR